MNAAVIKAFMASVGFQADDKSLKSALTKVAAFGAAVKAVATAIQAGVLKAAQTEAELARKAELLGTSTEKLREFDYAASASGLSLDQVTGAMEGLLKKFPRLGNGAKALELVSRNMASLSETQRRLYAQKLGLDPSLIPLLAGGLGKLRGEFQEMYGAIGLDGKRAAEASKGLTAEWGKLRVMGKMLASSALVPFMDKLADKFKGLREAAARHAGTFRQALDVVVKAVLAASQFISRMLERGAQLFGGFMDWMDSLTPGTQRLFKAMGVLAGAIALVFSPVLLVIGLVAGLLALLDDFATWAEGGESYFDWSWTKNLSLSFDGLKKGWEDLKQAIFGDIEMPKWLQEFLGWLQKAMDDVSEFFGWNKPAGEAAQGPAAQQAAVRTPQDFYDASMAFSPMAGYNWSPDEQGGNSVVQHNSTQIIVDGAKDPAAVGREVASQQDRVGANLVRLATQAAR